MSKLIVPPRKPWTPPQKQRGYVVLDAYRSAPPVTLPTVTWNPSDKSGTIVLSGGDLIASKAGSTGYGSVRATLPHAATDAGGHYFEVVINNGETNPYILVGVANASASLSQSVGANANGWSYYQETGQKFTNNVGAAYGASYTTGDVIGVLLKNGKLYFRKNGTWQAGADVGAETGAAFSGLTGSLFPMLSLYRQPNHSATGRFKASDFSGGIPAGASAWGG